MLHINSSEENVSASPEKVYQVLTHFFERPVQGVPGVTDWESLPDGCRFTLQDHVSCRLTLSEQTPYSRVGYRAETDTNMSAEVRFDITPRGAECAMQSQLDMEVPIFLQPFIKGAINNFMGMAMQYLKTAIENS